jgi:hypothetical protein
MMVALLIGATIANAQQVPDARVADVVHAGKIRVGLFCRNTSRTQQLAR